MAKKTKEEPKVNLVYAGMRVVGLHSKIYHYYINQVLGKGTGDSYFSRKLHPKHRVGLVYPLQNPAEGSYLVYSESGNPVGEHKNKREVVSWLVEDERAKHASKSKRERASLISMSRQAVQSLRPLYKRASFEGKNDILRAIVEELESE